MPVDFFGLEAIQQYLTGYADDLTVHKIIKSKADLRAARQLIQNLFDAVRQLKLRVTRPNILVKLSGTEAPSVIQKHTCWLPDAEGVLRRHCRLGPSRTFQAFRQESQVKYL